MGNKKALLENKRVLLENKRTLLENKRAVLEKNNNSGNKRAFWEVKGHVDLMSGAPVTSYPLSGVVTGVVTKFQTFF